MIAYGRTSFKVVQRGEQSGIPFGPKTQIGCQTEIAVLPAEPFNGGTPIETQVKVKQRELESGRPAQAQHRACLRVDWRSAKAHHGELRFL